jgi:hypothetical protein
MYSVLFVIPLKTWSSWIPPFPAKLGSNINSRTVAVNGLESNVQLLGMFVLICKSI